MVSLVVYMTALTTLAMGEELDQLSSQDSPERQFPSLLPDCPRGFAPHFEGNQAYCLRYHTQEHTFLDAATFCKEKGSFLAAPRSEKLNNGLQSIATQQAHIDYYWIGITDIDIEGDPRYHSDKKPLVWDEMFKLKINDSNDDDKDCVYASRLYRFWEYEECGKQYPFFCHAQPIDPKLGESCTDIVTCAPPLVCNNNSKCSCPLIGSCEITTKIQDASTIEHNITGDITTQSNEPKEPKESPSGIHIYILLYISLTVLIVGGILYFCFYFRKGRKNEEPKQTTSKAPTDPSASTVSTKDTTVTTDTTTSSDSTDTGTTYV